MSNIALETVMQNRPTISLAQAADIQAAHLTIFNKISDFNEEDWAMLLFEVGVKFAESFARLYPKELHAKIQEQLLQTPRAINSKHNWYWSWFRFKFMLHDLEYIKNKMYTQPFSYTHYKHYMLNDELLEKELLNEYSQLIK